MTTLRQVHVWDRGEHWEVVVTNPKRVEMISKAEAPSREAAKRVARERFLEESS